MGNRKVDRCPGEFPVGSPAAYTPVWNIRTQSATSVYAECKICGKVEPVVEVQGNRVRLADHGKD